MTSALSAVAGSTGALQAELQKAQRELSNCVNCDSAKTSSGQANIVKLRAEVQGIEQRIEKTRQAQSDATPAANLSPLGNFLDLYA